MASRRNNTRVRSRNVDLRILGIFATTFALTLVFAFVKFGLSSRETMDAAQKNTVFEQPSDLPSKILLETDVIVVLGGGAPSSIHEPPIYVQQRCDDAAKVIDLRKLEMSRSKARKFHESDYIVPILSLSAGTAHLPQLMSENGLPIWESTSSAAYLHEKHGIPYNTLFVETTSYDTIGNAFYMRTTHSDIVGWKRILVITNKV
jgi:uncharacterized SAM-binding protein YcdF (DUF218 family)